MKIEDISEISRRRIAKILSIAGNSILLAEKKYADFVLEKNFLSKKMTIEGVSFFEDPLEFLKIFGVQEKMDAYVDLGLKLSFIKTYFIQSVSSKDLVDIKERCFNLSDKVHPA